MLMMVLLMMGLTAEASPKADFNSKLFRQIDSCKTTGGREVFLVKQWHLEPANNTKDAKIENVYPQEKNQIEIYEQLLEWTHQARIDSIVAEGCEGKNIDSTFTTAFNGWTFFDLKSIAQKKEYDRVLTHPVLKLAAKLGDQIHAVCGDSIDEIKKSQLALSDARADIGYLAKINEFKNQAEREKIYLEGAIEILKMNRDSKTQDVLKALGSDLKKNIVKFQHSSHERNLSFQKTIQAVDSKKPIVLIVGGLHTADLKQILEESKLGCRIFEPIHYQNDEESLSEKLKTAVQAL